MDAPSAVRRLLYGARSSAGDGKTFKVSGLFEDAVPTFVDLLVYVAAGSVAIEIARLLIERLVLKPLKNVVFKSVRLKKLPCESQLLEEEFHKRHPAEILKDVNHMKKLSVETNLPINTVSRWFSHRISIERRKMRGDRFLESAFRLVVYSIAFALGYYLVKKDALENVEEYFSSEVDLVQPHLVKISFLLVQIPLYVHLMRLHLNDFSKKDFWEYALHHLVTISALSLTYLSGYTKLGVRVVLAHDVTDLFFESAKLANVSGRKTTSDVWFLGFTLAWFYARLYVFTFNYLVPIAFADVSTPVWYLFGPLLIVVWLLDVFWFKYILNLAMKILWVESNERASAKSGALSTDDERGNSTMSDFYSDGLPPLKRHED